jgi:outer membrane protein with beta-barrel domain
MFLRKTLFVFLLILTATELKAQSSLGFETGLTAGYLNTNIANRTSSEITYRLGYSIAIPFEYQFNKWLSVETVPGIVQKNYSITRTDSLSGAYTSFINTYLQLPVMAKAILFHKKKFIFFANAGFYYGYWMAARQKGNEANIFTATESNNSSGQTTSTIDYTSFNEKYTINDQVDNQSEWGWIAGLGAQKKIKERYTAYAAFRIYESFTQQQKNYMINQIPQYNETLALSVGVMMLLK